MLFQIAVRIFTDTSVIGELSKMEYKLKFIVSSGVSDTS